MDLTTNTPTKSDTDNETPPPPQPVRPLSFTNGALNKQLQLQLQRPPPVVVVYGECLKNHAASLGAHALDGCGEFMASPGATASDPTSLRCAACGCHRNFHRREPDESIGSPANGVTHFIDFRRQLPLPPRGNSTSPSPPPPPPPTATNYPHAPQLLLALSTAAPGDQPATNYHTVATPVTPTAAKSENPSGSRKRFRTRFSQEQKEKMLCFSEKLGWKMLKSDESVVKDFCNEIGVGKGVLKVWMHNNKNTFKKKSEIQKPNNNGSNNICNGVLKFEISSSSNDHHENECNEAHFDVPINGSSSSS